MKFWRIVLIAIVTVTALARAERTALAVNLPLDQMAVPYYDVWGPLPSDVKQELRLLVSESQEEIDRLLSSPDPREVGLGLFALEQRADLDRLVTLVDLVDDPRPTIPHAEHMVSRNEFIPVDQTIGEYLFHIYIAWLTLTPDEVRARKEEIRAMDPWARPYPWWQRMSRASNSVRYWDDTPAARDQRMAEIKLQVRQIPSAVRWAVITHARGDGFYSREEARAELLLLDQAVRDQVVAGGILETRANEIGWDVGDKELGAKCRDLILNAN